MTRFSRVSLHKGNLHEKTSSCRAISSAIAVFSFTLFIHIRLLYIFMKQNNWKWLSLNSTISFGGGKSIVRDQDHGFAADSSETKWQWQRTRDHIGWKSISRNRSMRNKSDHCPIMFFAVYLCLSSFTGRKSIESTKKKVKYDGLQSMNSLVVVVFVFIVAIWN